MSPYKPGLSRVIIWKGLALLLMVLHLPIYTIVGSQACDNVALLNFSYFVVLAISLLFITGAELRKWLQQEDSDPDYLPTTHGNGHQQHSAIKHCVLE